MCISGTALIEIFQEEDKESTNPTQKRRECFQAVKSIKVAQFYQSGYVNLGNRLSPPP